MSEFALRKFAVLSHILPPSSSGQAVVLYRLLRDCDPEKYCLLSSVEYPLTEMDSSLSEGNRITKRLAARYYHLPHESQMRVLHSTPFQLARRAAKKLLSIRKNISGGSKLGKPSPVASENTCSPKITVAQKSRSQGWKTRFRDLVNTFDDWFNLRSQTKQRSEAIVRILHKEKCEALVGCSGDLIDIPAGFHAAQKMGIPYYPYLFDDYNEQWRIPFQKKYAHKVWSQLKDHVSGIIVPNEFLANKYRESFQMNPIIIPNPVEDISPVQAPGISSMNRPVKIIYTGSIYDAHLDAFTNLLQAIHQLPEGAVEFHIYTPMDRSVLENYGISAPAILHPPLPLRESQQVQQQADLLFLPLAFESPIPDIIRTSAPGKMGELLASGRPILVHAPKDCFVSWYFREHKCGIVIDESNPEMLCDVLLSLPEQTDQVWQFVRNAAHRAHEDFHISKAHDEFFGLLANRARKSPKET